MNYIRDNDCVRGTKIEIIIYAPSERAAFFQNKCIEIMNEFDIKYVVGTEGSKIINLDKFQQSNYNNFRTEFNNKFNPPLNKAYTYEAMRGQIEMLSARKSNIKRNVLYRTGNSGYYDPNSLIGGIGAVYYFEGDVVCRYKTVEEGREANDATIYYEYR